MRLCKELTKICKQHQATIAFPSKSHLGIACVSHSAGPAQPQPHSRTPSQRPVQSKHSWGKVGIQLGAQRGSLYISDPMWSTSKTCPALSRNNPPQSSSIFKQTFQAWNYHQLPIFFDPPRAPYPGTCRLQDWVLGGASTNAQDDAPRSPFLLRKNWDVFSPSLDSTIRMVKHCGPFFPSGSGSRVPEPEVLHREDWIG